MDGEDAEKSVLERTFNICSLPRLSTSSGRSNSQTISATKSKTGVARTTHVLMCIKNLFYFLSTGYACSNRSDKWTARFEERRAENKKWNPLFQMFASATWISGVTPGSCMITLSCFGFYNIWLLGPFYHYYFYFIKYIFSHQN